MKIELTTEEKAVLALVVAEKDINPPDDTVLTEDQDIDAWFLIDLGLVKNIDLDDEWLYRPTEEGLKFHEENT